MKRTKQMQGFADSLAENISGQTLTKSQSKVVCAFCLQPAVNFKDALSAKEYTISGLCQTCQDEVFGG